MEVHGIDECLYLIKLLDFTEISKFCAILVLFYCFFLWVKIMGPNYQIIQHLSPSTSLRYRRLYIRSINFIYTQHLDIDWNRARVLLNCRYMFLWISLPLVLFMVLSSHLNVCFLLNGCFDVECMIDVFLLCKYSFCSDKGSVPT